ncbi:MAG: TetR/AcrR family transcriptional regulator [Verrucomicrobiales bacterium]
MSPEPTPNLPPKLDKREQRHLELLIVARDVLIRSGLAGFSIDQVAKLAGYSRPTVYSHFSSKNEVLDALARKNLELGVELIEQAKRFEGTARERSFALVLGYEVMARFYPEEFHVTELLGMSWVRESLPKSTAGAFASMVETFYAALLQQIERAVEEGELVLRPGLTKGNVVFHSLAMANGIYSAIIKERIILRLSDPAEPWAEARAALQCYWDGIGWQEAETEIGYPEVADRFLKESFPELWLQLEVEKLKKASGLSSGVGASLPVE